MMSLTRFSARLCSKTNVVSQTRCSTRRYKSSPAVETKAKSAAEKPAEKAAEKAESTPVAQAAIAAILGVATVSAAAATVENATAGSVPKFHPSTQRFDQTDFSGRFSKMLLACDPRLLFYTEDQVRSSKAMVENYKDYEGMDRALWEARRIVDSALHPDTGDTIPRPFRMSGYVPYNGPICVAILASQSTLPLLFWAWVNQSQNALVNYYNRNGSSPMKNETLALSYGAAVGSALFVAFGLATAIQKRFEPSKAKQLLKYVAFPSAVVASTLNCYIIRSPEIESGIPLTDKEGQAILPGDTSSVAAAQGVYTTTASRAILQIPVYVFAPVLLALPPFLQILARAPRMHVPLTTYLVLVSFGVGLPATTAIFPQISSIAAADVEPKFQHLRDSNDKTYEVYYYNKGL
jgi:tricarboxylate carrier